MATIYVRDVPQSVSDALKNQAAAEGLSLSMYIAQALSRLAEVPTNAQLVAALRAPRRAGASTQQILDALQEQRR